MTEFSVVQREFKESLGYLKQDLKWLLEKKSNLNYTIALLIGCGCEMLAACAGDRKRLGERVFAELLPPTDELQVLADRLYSALRDGLAHGFDTKHLRVGGKEHQIAGFCACQRLQARELLAANVLCGAPLRRFPGECK